MRFNYLIESSSFILIQKEIESICSKLGFQKSLRNTYDLEECSLSSALEDLDTYSFLSDKKIIIIKNLFLEKNEKKIDHFFKYIENPSSSNLLFILVDKLDSRLNLSKKLIKNKNITYIKKEMDLYQYVKDKLFSYKIENNLIRLLIEKCQKDITRIDSECEKLMIYKIEEKEIQKEDIENLVIKKLKDSNEVLFSLTNALLERDKKKSLVIYEELGEYQLDVHSIIGLLASQLKMITQIKILKEEGLKNQEIAERLGGKSLYQIKKLSEYTTYSFSRLGSMIHSLCDLDLKIKGGRIDVNNALITFILGL